MKDKGLNNINNISGESLRQRLDKGNNGKNVWILDIEVEATNHVTCSLSLFISYHKIKSIIILLSYKHGTKGYIVIDTEIFIKKTLFSMNPIFVK